MTEDAGMQQRLRALVDEAARKSPSAIQGRLESPASKAMRNRRCVICTQLQIDSNGPTCGCISP